jgi:cyclase
MAINTAAVSGPDLVRRAAARWGSQAIVVAIDARSRRRAGGWTVVTRRPPRHRPRRDGWAEDRARRAGILLTSADRDGTAGGYVSLPGPVADAVPVGDRVGGVRTEHPRRPHERADAALAASIFDGVHISEARRSASRWSSLSQQPRKVAS